jgi:hypothetical protein
MSQEYIKELKKAREQLVIERRAWVQRVVADREVPATFKSLQEKYLFDNEAIPLWVWPWLFIGGLVFFLVVEAEKLIIRSSAGLRRVVTAVESGRDRS